MHIFKITKGGKTCKDIWNTKDEITWIDVEIQRVEKHAKMYKYKKWKNMQRCINTKGGKTCIDVEIQSVEKHAKM